MGLVVARPMGMSGQARPPMQECPVVWNGTTTIAHVSRSGQRYTVPSGPAQDIPWALSPNPCQCDRAWAIQGDVGSSKR